MTETDQDFVTYQGDDATIHVTVTESGAAKDLSGLTDIEWVVVDPADTVVLSKTMTGGGIAVTGAATGEFEITIDAADTATLDPGFYTHEADVIDASSNNVTVMTGAVTLRESNV